MDAVYFTKQNKMLTGAAKLTFTGEMTKRGTEHDSLEQDNARRRNTELHYKEADKAK